TSPVELSPPLLFLPLPGFFRLIIFLNDTPLSASSPEFSLLLSSSFSFFPVLRTTSTTMTTPATMRRRARRPMAEKVRALKMFCVRCSALSPEAGGGGDGTIGVRPSSGFAVGLGLGTGTGSTSGFGGVVGSGDVVGTGIGSTSGFG
ncbi:hypothetical protein PFISCL1PPCAC_21093, partial [Pristionchus fissidentatus]